MARIYSNEDDDWDFEEYYRRLDGLKPTEPYQFQLEQLTQFETNFRERDDAFKPEIGRNLCRVVRITASDPFDLFKELFPEEEKNYGGYKKDILTENLNEREKAGFICTVCEGIMKDACISYFKEQFCSCCSPRRGNPYRRKTPDVSVRKMINSLKCSCPLSERGCKWLGSLEDCENHLDTCGYVHEKCKLECGVELTRNELRVHEKDTCVRRMIRCEHCSISVKSCDKPQHLEECPRVRVPCELCNVEMYREEMTEHIEKYCPEEMIECPFVKYKCLTRIKRKDMDKHLEENETKHLGLKLTAMEDLITKQSEKIDEQSEKIDEQSEKMNEQNEKMNEQNEKMNEQSEKMNEQNEKITKLQVELGKHKMYSKLLYSIIDVTTLIWTIENVTDLIMGHGFSESERYKVAGYSFFFRMSYNREVSIVFPATTFKHANPFRAKCHITLCINTINCGLIEVKQKDLTRGCERIITSISRDVDKYSKPKFPGDEKKYLTLWMYITML